MRVPSLLCSLLAFVPLARAQHYDRAELRAHAAVIARSPMVFGERLCVKLAEGSGAELRDGRLVSRTGVELGAVRELFSAARVEPLFQALSWDALDELHRNACAVLPANNRPGHLGLWFRLTLPSVAAADALTERLFDDPLVEHVHKEPRATPASAPSLLPPPPGDIAPPTPDFTSLQGTHQPSPAGYGVWLAQGVYGARGQSVELRMIEDDWILDHEDVSECVAANFLGPTPGQVSAQANHGVASASLVGADRNGYGMTGVADRTRMKFISELNNGGAANSILIAIANSQPGDVHLMVLMFLLGQIGTLDWVPLEFLQSVFDVTLTATANGRLFVTTGANGGNSLDDPRFARRFDRGFRDSGAIMIEGTAGSTLQRGVFANYGSRIDGNGWGDGVVACGAGTLFFPNNDLRQTYTASYAGTSAAVPAIAGVVCALQGAARAQLGRSVTTAEVLDLLHNHGPLSPDFIGRRADLVGMLRTMGAIDGLEVSTPDLRPGGSVTATMSGPAGSGGFLFFSLTPGNTSFGLNRPVLLGLPTLQTLTFLPMPSGTAAFPIGIPNDQGLSGIDLYLQAGVLQTAAPVHVTNSCQVTVL